MRDSIGPPFNSLRSMSTRLVLLAAAAFASIVAFPVRADARSGTFVSFDVPSCRDISPIGINPAGTITGNCVIAANSNLVPVGFLRTPPRSSTSLAQHPRRSG
jgi:hypothetical protein